MKSNEAVAAERAATLALIGVPNSCMAHYDEEDED